MANCYLCGSETDLYFNDQPICITCDEERERLLVLTKKPKGEVKTERKDSSIG